MAISQRKHEDCMNRSTAAMFARVIRNKTMLHQSYVVASAYAFYGTPLQTLNTCTKASCSMPTL